MLSRDLRPAHNGHLDVIARAAAAFDEVIVATGVNQSKKRLFGSPERVEMLTELVEPFGNVRVGSFDGLWSTTAGPRAPE